MPSEGKCESRVWMRGRGWSYDLLFCVGAEDFDSVESALMLVMVSLINRVSGRQRRYRCGG